MTSRLALIALAAGCGSAHHTVDANRDTSSDTLVQTTADAPPGSVTITVTSQGVAVPGVGVYFQSSDNSLVLGAMTDAHGTVGAVLGVNSFVTAIEPVDGGGLIKLDTFAGVQPGDALHLDLAPLGSQGGATTAMTVSVASAGSATAIKVFSPCGAGTLATDGTGEIGWQGCPLQTDLLVAMVDDTNAPIGEYFMTNQTIGPAANDAAGYPLNIAGPAYDFLSHATYDYTNVPAAIAYVNTTQELWSTRGRLYTAAVDILNNSQRTGTSVHSLQDQPAPSTAGFSAVTVSEFVPTTDSGLHGEQLVYDWGTYAAAYGPLDYGQIALAPYMTDPVFDTTAHAITWTEGTGATPQFARAAITVYRDAIPSGRTWQWNLIGPRTAAASLAFPTLPASDFDYNPNDTDQISIANLTNAKLSSGTYDNVRAHGFASLGSVADPTALANGRLLVQLPYSSPL